jgi:hypothetical protein
MATSDAISVLSTLLREELHLGRKEMEPKIDGTFSKIYTTSRGVKRGIGRAWQRVITFSTGVAGAGKNVDASGPATPDTGNFGQSGKWATPSRTYPGVTDQAFPGSVQKKITLVELMGSIAVPLHWAEASALDASMLDEVDRLIRGNARHMAQMDADAFYSNNATTRALLTVTDSTSAFVTAQKGTGGIIDFDMAGCSGRIGRFVPGMMVDYVDESQATDVPHAKGGAGLIVTKVDYLAKQITCWNGSDSGATMSLDDDDYLIQAGSLAGGTVYGTSGMESWLINTGTAFNLNVANQPQFKSLIASVGAVLDDQILNKYIAGFYDAYGGMWDLDSIITTSGVAVSYLESLDGLGRFQRNAKAMTVKGGWISIDYTFGGEPFELLISRYQLAGQAYIVKMGDNNIKRYVPPPMKGSQGGNGLALEYQWVAPMMGSRNIFLPDRNSSAALTQFMLAPYNAWRELCPEQIPGIKLTGCVESNP